MPNRPVKHPLGSQGGSKFLKYSVLAFFYYEKSVLSVFFWPFSYEFYRELVHFMRSYAEASIQPNFHGPDMRPSSPICVMWVRRVALHALQMPGKTQAKIDFDGIF